MNDFLIKSIKKYLPKTVVNYLKAVYRAFFRFRAGMIRLKKFDKSMYPKGINLIGPVQHDTGLGQSCRLIASELEASKVSFLVKNFSISKNISSTDRTFEHKMRDTVQYGINLIHINMHEFEKSILELGKNTLDYRYNIAFWLWEMEKFPDEWISMLHYVDEIWTPSEFTSKAIRKITEKKVMTIPYHVRVETDENTSRAALGLPEDKFLFLMMFDKNSIMERKNPMGIIDAFKRAFPKGKEDVGLVIKINNLDEAEVDQLKHILSGYHVYFIREMFTKPQVNQFIKIMDVYVSLHRTEGFGLVLAEAMLLGVPTISTNYSSTTEFQDKESACLVDWTRVEVGKDVYPYKKNDTWANPNIDQAAKYMVRLYTDRDFYNNIKTNGMEKVKSTLDLDRIVCQLESRVDEIYREKR